MPEPTESYLRRRVLLVEDELLVALDMADLLSSLGFEVIGPAARVDDALRLAEQSLPFTVGVLDVNLAGKRSWPVARFLKAHATPFFFVSGYLASHAGLPDDLADALICSKPVDLKTLKRAIEVSTALAASK